MLCPCGTKRSYTSCCEPLILDKAKAESPEQLMRSRYTAYALQSIPYIYDTYAKISQKQQTIKDIEAWANDTKWLNLRIVTVSDYIKNDKPTVQFEAIYKNEGVLYRMSEKSSFIKENDTWRYLDGTDLKFNEITPPNRNDKCICLSGLKFKKCCGNK